MGEFEWKNKCIIKNQLFAIIWWSVCYLSVKKIIGQSAGNHFLKHEFVFVGNLKTQCNCSHLFD